MAAEKIEQHSAVQAARGNAARLTLYDETGHPFEVPASDREHWLKRGFNEQPYDLKNLAKSMEQKFGAAQRAVGRYVSSTEERKHIDTSDGADKRLAEVAMADLVQTWVNLHQGLQVKYPESGEGKDVVVRLKDGTEVRHDPGQVLFEGPDGIRAVAASDIPAMRERGLKPLDDKAARKLESEYQKELEQGAESMRQKRARLEQEGALTDENDRGVL
jgi:hypothetical protein